MQRTRTGKALRTWLYALGVAALAHGLALSLLLLDRPHVYPIRAVSIHLVPPLPAKATPIAASRREGRERAARRADSPPAGTSEPLPLASSAALSSAPPSSEPDAVAAVAALQFAAACQQARRRGAPLPPHCANIPPPAPLGPRPVPEFAAATAAINAHRAYQAAAGSPDFWGRSHTSGSPLDRGDGLETYGLYTGDPVKQRVFGLCASTSSCTSDRHDPRGPDYHPGFVKWADPKDQK